MWNWAPGENHLFSSALKTLQVSAVKLNPSTPLYTARCEALSSFFLYIVFRFLSVYLIFYFKKKWVIEWRNVNDPMLHYVIIIWYMTIKVKRTLLFWSPVEGCETTEFFHFVMSVRYVGIYLSVCSFIYP